MSSPGTEVLIRDSVRMRGSELMTETMTMDTCAPAHVELAPPVGPRIPPSSKSLASLRDELN